MVMVPGWFHVISVDNLTSIAAPAYAYASSMRSFQAFILVSELALTRLIQSTVAYWLALAVVADIIVL